MRFGFLIFAAGLLAGCQPSIEKQAERELAIEELKAKKRQQSSDKANAGTELLHIRVALMRLPANESKTNLDILNECELRHGNSGKIEALGCYNSNKK